MNNWQRVSKAEPCPVCGKPDWCCIGDQFVNCMRVEAEKQCTNGGWLHPIDSAPNAPLPPRRPKEPSVDVWPIYSRWLSSTRDNPDRIMHLSRLLGIDGIALALIGTAWSPEYSSWAFPMVDANKRVIGVRLRNERGDKWSVRGGRSGVFYPNIIPTQRAFICEGATDVAALLHIGLFAIGRPSCNEGGNILCELLPKLGVRSAVIVADHDEDKVRPDGTRYNPGVDGSVRLSERLPVPNCIWLPPTKDARQFVRMGGTAAQIEAMIKGTRWQQPADRN